MAGSELYVFSLKAVATPVSGVGYDSPLESDMSCPDAMAGKGCREESKDIVSPMREG